jgi:hypothetical protein
VTVEIKAIPPWEVAAVASDLHHLIDRAWSRGCDTPVETMVYDALDLDAVMWLALVDRIPKGVCFTRRRMPAIWVTVAGGSTGLIWAPPLRARLHVYRAAEGASHLTWRGRRGWARLFGIEPQQGPDNLWTFEDHGT